MDNTTIGIIAGIGVIILSVLGGWFYSKSSSDDSELNKLNELNEANEHTIMEEQNLNEIEMQMTPQDTSALTVPPMLNDLQPAEGSEPMPISIDAEEMVESVPKDEVQQIEEYYNMKSAYPTI